MLKKSFNNISLRGRIAFCIMCFESFVKNKYPGNDYSPVCMMMWRIVGDSDYIDNSAYQYMEIIPEYLYEFDSFEASDFEYLSKADYHTFSLILPETDTELNTIMHRIYDIAIEYAYGAVPSFGKKTIDYVFDVLKILEYNSITLPDINNVSNCVFSQSDGWGDFISSDGLSLYI